MITMREAVSALALVWLASLVTACGPSSSTPRASANEPLASSQSTDPGFRLMSAQNQINTAINQSGVTTADPGTAAATPAAPDCALTASDPNKVPVFKNLQNELQGIQQNIQDQNTDDLTADLQAFQDALMADLDDLMSQIQKCIPAGSSLPAMPSIPALPSIPNIPSIPNMSSLPTGSTSLPSLGSLPGAGQAGIPNFDFQQFFGQKK